MDERQCLESLLQDIDSLKELTNYVSDDNIFSILRLGGIEIRHSIMLAYLLNPNETHGLGSKVMETFITKLAVRSRNENISLFDLIDIDYYDFSVIREYKNIDLLIKSSKYKIAICIENKIWSGEHSNQLNRYKKTIDEELQDYRKMFVFLSPEGIEASDTENWISINYELILSIIESMDMSNINEKIKLLIQDYGKLIRRNIMTDIELKEICNKIYRKHKQAIDLIIENKDDDVYYFFSIINDYLNDKKNKGVISYDEKNASPKVLRFSTPMLDSEFPLLEDKAVSIWRNGRTCNYCVSIKNNKLFCELFFSNYGVDKDTQYIKIKKYLEKLNLKSTQDAWANGHHISARLGDVDIIDDNIFDVEKDTKNIWTKLDKIFVPLFDKETGAKK